MTSVEHGGPTLEQKRAFSCLREGAHVPGYRGHCPDLKFRFGQTYGQDTSELSQIRRCRLHEAEAAGEESQITNNYFKLPHSTGENKYTENMTSGYTGYVPRSPFKFGKTYREECDVCLAEFLAARDRVRQRERETLLMTRSTPDINHVPVGPLPPHGPTWGSPQGGLSSVTDDQQVRDHLNSFRDRNFHSSGAQTRKQLTEAPIPGYRGYIPRVRTTELGLGTRYHDMTKNGLDNFYTARYEREKKYGPLPDTFGAQRHEPTIIKRSLTTLPLARNDTKSSESVTAGRDKRLYVHDGMIPNYTGYVPQLRYTMGYTFGDETRSLDVCAHDHNCYGDFIKHHRRQL